MQRRDLLRAFGAATALALLPHDAVAAWSRVASGVRPSAGFNDAQLALVDAIANTIIPRTDTPGAVDVGVAAFVDVIVTENFTAAERLAFVAGLDALSVQLRGADGTAFSERPTIERGEVIGTLERGADRRAEPERTYWRLKGLVVHGYFSSEQVMKTVLKVEIMPGAFDGSAPMRSKQATGGTRG